MIKWIVACLLLIGCSTTVESFRGANGNSNWLRITCRDNPFYCWREAGNECNRGYTIYQQTQTDSVIETIVECK